VPVHTAPSGIGLAYAGRARIRGMNVRPVPGQTGAWPESNITNAQSIYPRLTASERPLRRAAMFSRRQCNWPAPRSRPTCYRLLA
jgi:hypothetical protein